LLSTAALVLRDILLFGYIKRRRDKLTCFSKDNAKSTLIKHNTYKKVQSLKLVRWNGSKITRQFYKMGSIGFLRF